MYTRYAHLAPDFIRLKPGNKVPVGTVVGEMGNSGRFVITLNSRRSLITV